MSLQDNLRTLRERAGYTQAKDFAENVLNMSYSTYMGYETRGTWPSEETLVKIADALHVTIDELLGYAINECEKYKREIAKYLGGVEEWNDGTIHIPITKGIGIFFERSDFIEWAKKNLEVANDDNKKIRYKITKAFLQEALLKQLEPEHPGITKDIKKQIISEERR